MEKINIEDLLAAYSLASADEQLEQTLFRRWQHTRPGILTLAEFKAGQHPFKRILERFLAQDPVSRLLLKSGAVTVLAESMRAKRQSSAALQSLTSCIGLIREQQGILWQAGMLPDQRKLFSWRTSSEDGKLRCELRETIYGKLYLEIINDSNEYKDKTMDVELLFHDGEVIWAKGVKMEALGKKASGEHYFGEFSEFAERLSHPFVLTAVPSDRWSAERLEDPESGSRSAAVLSLGQMGSAAATPEILGRLLTFLDNTESGVRSAAAEALGQMGGAAATPEILMRLLTLLEDPESGVRSTAARALGQLGGAAARAEILGRLLTLLEDPESRVRSAAAEALRQCGGWT